MKPLRSPRFLVPFALLGLSGLGSAQEVEGSHPSQLVLQLSDLMLERYAVRNVDADDLSVLANSMIGRRFQVKENGPGSPLVSSMRQLGSTIVLYDTKEQIQRAVELLARLDVARESTRSPRKIIEYRPRFVSLNTAYETVDNHINASLVRERGFLVLEGTTPSVDEALALLERIDVPEKQVLLTCQLLDVDSSEGGAELGAELRENLQRLLPDSHFTQAGMAILKTSVGGQSPISVQIETKGKRYDFSFVPVAFDEKTSSLTVADCLLYENVDNGVRELFRTNTVLRGGEYTALAATGAQTRLLVVRVTPQD